MRAGSTTAARTALYAVSEFGEFGSLLALAEVVHSKLGLHPVFVFKHDYGAFEYHTQQLDVLGFSWVSSGRASLRNDFSSSSPGDGYLVNRPISPAWNGPSLGTRWNAATAITWFANVVTVFAAPVVVVAAVPLLIWRRARLRIGTKGIKSLLRPFPGPLRWRYARLLREMRKIFEIFRPMIVISGQDYPLSVTTIASLVAAERGIATAVVPFSMTPTTKELAESFAGSKTNLLRGRVITWLVMSRFAKWVNLYRGRLYTRLSFSEILVAEGLGLAPALPWVPNSGRGMLLLPGQQSFDYCSQAGIPAEQMRITGAVWADQLWSSRSTREQRRAELVQDIDAMSLRPRSKKHSTEDRKILLVSWPPNQSPRAATGLRSYKHLCDELARMLTSIDGEVRIAISLHPTLAATNIRRMLERQGFFVLSGSLNDALDCCDIFVATVSSTLLWSLQLGIPSINFDIYRYGYREFREAGMAEATSVHELRSILLNIIRNPQECEDIVKAMSAERPRWGSFDGRSIERIINELRSLLSVKDTDNKVFDPMV